MSKSEHTYQIAGIHIRAVCDERWIIKDEGVLKEYVSVSECEDVVLNCRVVDELSAPCGIAVLKEQFRQVYQNGNEMIVYAGDPVYMRISRIENKSDVEVMSNEIPYGITSHFMMKVMELEHLLAQRMGILLHAAMIEHEGKAILFTAPSQTGKSTQAQLWCENRNARLINGDRAAVVVEKEICAYGIPFSGSSSVRENARLPLKAIVYLAQAKENKAVVLSGAQAFRRIWEGCSIHSYDESDVEKCADTVMDIVSNVPVIHLACRPDESAVHVLEAVLSGREESESKAN